MTRANDKRNDKIIIFISPSVWLQVSYNHTWLGCMLCTANTGNHSLDLAHHLHAASKAFFANRPYLVNRNVAMQDRFRYFNAMVTPVACFSAAHRKVYKQDLCKKDIDGYCASPVAAFHCWAGPTGDVDWTLPWHEILHHWNERCSLCFQLARRAMSRESTELVSRKRSTSCPPCLHFGFDDSTVLHAQSTGKLATTCPGHLLLDESIG